MVCVYNVVENQRWDRFDTYYSEPAERDEDSVSHLHSQMILQGERVLYVLPTSIPTRLKPR